MDVELQDGKKYIVNSGNHWGIYVFRHRSREWADNLLFSFGGAGVVIPSECDQIIPLELATQAPALQAEVARLRAERRKTLSFLNDIHSHAGDVSGKTHRDLLDKLSLIRKIAWVVFEKTGYLDEIEAAITATEGSDA